MARPRLVVVEGPDVGLEFVVPEKGGAIGRAEGSAVRLSDLSVSRAHCTIEPRDGGVALVEPGDRNNTRVNGRLVQDHVLVEGDEIQIGSSRLVFLPAHGSVPLMMAATRSAVTLEVPAAALLGAAPDAAPELTRSRSHLQALALLGEGLRAAADARSIARTACEALRKALGAGRALLFVRDAGGSLAAAGAALATDHEDPKLTLSREVQDKLLQQAKAIMLDGDGELARPAVAAPVLAVDGTTPLGLLYADKALLRGAVPWAEPDLELCACVAHFVGAALDGAAARDAMVREHRALEERSGASSTFVGESAAARAVVTLASKVAQSDTTVLIIGESGAGKELVASAIHKGSRRAQGPFVAVNCAALSETVLESELFGHEKGSFTGATERKLGRFEIANGGTLFLDEVGEITPRCQAKFLRVLEERRFERVGGTRPISVDVRIIAATNANLETMMKEGAFREDLFYRLSVVRVPVPPLRDRVEDIAAIAEHLLARVRFQTGRRVAGFTPEALGALRGYPWPGNVRELRNAIEHAVVLGDGARIGREDLPAHVLAGGGTRRASRAPPPAAAATRSSAPPAASLRDVEKRAIVEALAATQGNKRRAAALLQIDRSTLYKKLKEYRIE